MNRQDAKNAKQDEKVKFRKAPGPCLTTNGADASVSPL